MIGDSTTYPLLTPADVGKRLQIAPKTVKKLPIVRVLVGSLIRYREEDVDAYIRSKLQDPHAYRPSRTTVKSHKLSLVTGYVPTGIPSRAEMRAIRERMALGQK